MDVAGIMAPGILPSLLRLFARDRHRPTLHVLDVAHIGHAPHAPCADHAEPRSIPVHAPRAIDRWPERAVLVLAPHMDDETIGCGGVVLLHKRAGARVTVGWLTDGRQGSAALAGLRGAGRRAAEEALAATRRREALAAAAALGVDDHFFRDEPDGGLHCRPALANQLAAQLTTWLQAPGPHVLYLPFPTDPHADHRATAQLACAALLRLPHALVADLRLRAYEISSPVPANRVADIGAVQAGKERALACHVSQLHDVDYQRCVAGLNAWRSLALGDGRGYAEAFFETGPDEWAALQAGLQQVQGAAPICLEA